MEIKQRSNDYKVFFAKGLMLRALGIIGGLNAGGFLLTAAIKSEVGVFFLFRLSLFSLLSLSLVAAS